MYENTIAEPNTSSPSGSAGDNSQHLLIGAYGDSSGLGGAQDSMRGLMQEVIYYASDRSSNLLDLNANLNSYFQITNLPATSSGLFYDYPDAAAAYSVRSLSNNAVKCMRVRRTVSPFDEQDIGFDSNGDLDTAAIAAFGGSDPLMVSAWYDQSGSGNNVTQGTAGSQPQIYDGAAVITENGRPALSFDGSNDYLSDSVTLSANAYSFFGVANTTGAAQRTLFRDRPLGSIGSREGIVFWEQSSSDVPQFLLMEDNSGNAVGIGGLPVVTDAQHLVGTDFGASTARAYLDGSSIGTPDQVQGGTLPLSVPVAVDLIDIGGNVSSRWWSSTVQEIILYDNDQSTNRTGFCFCMIFADIQSNCNA